MRNLTLKHFRLLAALAETGSRKAASERLHVSIGAVSKSFAELEMLVGDHLLALRDGKLSVTEKGALMVAAGLRIQDELNALEVAFSDTRSGLSDRVTIGYATTGLRPFLRDLLIETKRRHPLLTVSAARGVRPSLLRQLRSGMIDMFVGSIAGLAQEQDLGNLPLCHDEYLVLSGIDDPITDRQARDWKFLTARPWLLPGRDMANHTYFANFLRQMDMPMPLDVIETDGLFFERGDLDRYRLILTTAHAAAACQIEERFRRLDVVLPQTRLPSGLAWSGAPRPRPSVQAVIDIARSIASQPGPLYAFA
ncbi:LysR family transcriptional regulator [Gluconacetobacter tumulisoli]|uniref:LysR family transcriptional regulator n=1 Tax=Gluconacetobacter tumulisoli TaxID=1286189 RepID=A0A7W4K5U4_9PROT|nr:LysR family transcriptional regulator [Gluconacetobacter tumulisoli]MBB2200911.1 LysR family transcriptional regulator [Gluconacetobacter tumulisoli]